MDFTCCKGRKISVKAHDLSIDLEEVVDRLCTTGSFIKKEVYDTWNEPMVVVRVGGKMALCI